ncbi:MAG TPA: type II secretion system minor pseudopilin GspK [Candidatus Binataceae bacterium]|nr:type II secretion system minor pseudopilin GspK [Candidatus Binataceae bacterium]
MVITARRKYDRGIALLATLLAVSLMTLLVIEFTTSAALGYRSAANLANQIRASYLARSGIQVGLAVLARDSLNDALQKTPHDGLDEAWAQPIAPIVVDGGVVSLSIVDETRKIDVNNLFNKRTMQVDPAMEAMLLRLFSNIGVSPDLMPVLIDWLDPDSIESDGGAEAGYYLSLTPPYEPRNGPMPTIGDLRMLKGMNDAVFLQLSQYLTTMPEMRINVNTAPPQVLAALAPELENDPQLVEQIVQIRQARPFLQITDLANEIPGIGAIAASGRLSSFVTMRSSYFTITAQGEFAGARKRIYATFRRNLNGTAMLMNWHED